jgi:hypothetical protein
MMRAILIVITTIVATTSVSAVVKANKHPHIILRPTQPLPAVNVP